jgi:hypothetical protein
MSILDKVRNTVHTLNQQEQMKRKRRKYHPVDEVLIGQDRLDEIHHSANEETKEIIVDTLKVAAVICAPPLIIFKWFRDPFSNF